MHLKQRRTSTDQRLRSLLQKAARRGCSTIVQRVAAYLHTNGDKSWVRSRSVVITFEECWPLAVSLSIDSKVWSKCEALARVTSTEKQKDAAGLGALAYALQQGDTTTLEFAPDRRKLRIVAEAIERPKEFFAWVAIQAQSEFGRTVAKAAQQYLPAATWGWDKACLLAGALLGTEQETSMPNAVETAPSEFPYWVALDKHTEEGKRVLKEVSKDLQVSYRQILWSSFYCESAITNSLHNSPWFEAERRWRLAKCGLSPTSAADLWGRSRSLVSERLQVEANQLKRKVDGISDALILPEQSRLI